MSNFNLRKKGYGKKWQDLYFQNVCWNQELTSSQLEVISNIHRRTINRWKQCIDSFGMPPYQWKRLEKARIKRYGISFYSRTLSERNVQKMVDLVLQHPEMYVDEIQLKMFKAVGIWLSPTTILRTLHGRGLTLKELSNMAESLDDSHRADFLLLIHNITDKPEQFIFVDEASKDKSASRRNKVWTIRGFKPRGKFICDRNYGYYTFIAAANMNGFVTAACTTIQKTTTENSNTSFNQQDIGTIDRERFEKYVEYDLQPILGNYALGEPNSIVILDNASIGRGPKVRELVEAVGAILIYLPTTSPDLNPIEEMFRTYKASLRRRLIANVEVAHMHAMASVTPAMARKFFSHLKGAIRNVKLLEDEEEKNKKEILVTEEAAATATAIAAAVTIFHHYSKKNM
jgi:transposase